MTTRPEIINAGRYSGATVDRDMNRKIAAAPIVATVIEKMLSTMLYWKTDKSGIAATRTPFNSIISSTLLSEN